VILPNEAAPVLAALLTEFTRPTAARFTTLLAAALLTSGRHTVANLLRTLCLLAPGDGSAYRRVLSRARWSGVALGCSLAALLLRLFPPDGPSFSSGTTPWTATRPQGLRQGPPPRPGPFHPHPRRLALRP
jgi:DDE superfamily endonuclease